MQTKWLVSSIVILKFLISTSDALNLMQTTNEIVHCSSGHYGSEAVYWRAYCKQGAMATLIDCAVLGGENPKKGDASSGGFRLQSELSGEATCSGSSSPTGR